MAGLLDHDELSNRFQALRCHLSAYEAVDEHHLELVFREACRFLGVGYKPLLGILCHESPSLILIDQYISKMHFLALAVSLPFRTWTTSFVLGPQRLDSCVLHILSSGISQLRLLSLLDVSHNPVGSLGVLTLVRVARQCPSLKIVNIDGIEAVPSLRNKLDRILAPRRS